MAEITAFLIVRNEELLLPRCLESLAQVVDRVVVLDTGSQDGTQDILRRFAGRTDFPPLTWREQPFVDFGTTRQAALQLVGTEWAFWIDADEQVSAELSARIRSLQADGALESHDGWEIRRVNRVLGRIMRARNLANDYVLRLFKTRCGRITPTQVHEGLQLQAGCSVGRLEEQLLHDSMVSWRSYLAKVNHYTSLDAARGIRSFSLFHLLTAPLANFYRHYLARGGIRDGWPGFVWAATSAWSILLRDLKLLARAVRRGC
jgi:(heptosyl)LPS beta-1,4-glucosyltransferase